MSLTIERELADDPATIGEVVEGLRCLVPPVQRPTLRPLGF